MHLEKENMMLIYICKRDPCEYGSKGVVVEGGKQKILSPALVKNINLKVQIISRNEMVLITKFFYKAVGKDAIKIIH